MTTAFPETVFLEYAQLNTRVEIRRRHRRHILHFVTSNGEHLTVKLGAFPLLDEGGKQEQFKSIE